jgi:hypothetical protein
VVKNLSQEAREGNVRLGQWVRMGYYSSLREGSARAFSNRK